VSTELLAQSAVNAFVLSSLYILMALGFALLLSIMGIVNFAHSVIYMAGGYICYEFVVGAGLNNWLALVATVLLAGAFGLVLERFCFRPFLGDSNRVIVMTLAIVVTVESLINVLVGTEVRAVPTFWAGSFRVGSVAIAHERLIAFVVAAVLLVAVIFFIRNTRRGQQMLAVSQDFVGATLQGINIYRVTAIASVIACALAAVAGSLMGSLMFLNPYAGDQMLVKAIEVVILAGIGSIGGVLVGGCILGVLGAFLPLWLDGNAVDAIGLAIVIIILLLRPQGLFGHEA
jgi:branched-chain amino acid transport system permease protein